jgi:hypothetical protein
MSLQLENNGPVGSQSACSKNGWINEELFFQWFHHFTSYVKYSKNESVLLMLDNHASHVSLRMFNYCRNNGIVMLSIPAHSSHRLQPLDLTFSDR